MMRFLKSLFLGLLAVVLLLAALGAGAYLSLRRPDTPYSVLDAKYKNSASRFVALRPGLEVHYRDQGAREGRTLVLIHGFSSSLHTWEPWIERLQGEYRLVSLDLPGHGLTRTPADFNPTMEDYADLVAQFMEAIDLDQAVIVGSSMGGSAAWNVALRHPDKVSGLVLVASSGWPDERVDNQPEAAIFKLLKDPTLGPLMRDLENRTLVRQGLQNSFFKEALVDKAMVDRYVDMSRAPNHRAALLKITLGFKDRAIATPEAMATIKVPTLVMHGIEDRLVPVAGGRAFAQTIPGAKAVFYDKVGHIPQEEIPDRSASDLIAFLEEAY